MRNHLIFILGVGLALIACQPEAPLDTPLPIEEAPIEEPTATPQPTETPIPTPTFLVEGDTSTGIVLIVLSPEFEYPEYEGIRFNLERLGCRVVVASIAPEQPVGFNEVHRYEPAQAPPGEMPEVTVDLTLEDARVGDYDAIVFISDPSWFSGEAERAVDFAREAADAGLVVGGLSNVVSMLGRAGLLENVRVTGFPCDQMETVYGAICTWTTVERDGRIVTGDVSFPCRHFAEAIVEALQEDL